PLQAFHTQSTSLPWPLILLTFHKIIIYASITQTHRHTHTPVSHHTTQHTHTHTHTPHYPTTHTHTHHYHTPHTHTHTHTHASITQHTQTHTHRHTTHTRTHRHMLCSSQMISSVSMQVCL